jgi:hypothetical protein
MRNTQHGADLSCSVRGPPDGRIEPTASDFLGRSDLAVVREDVDGFDPFRCPPPTQRLIRVAGPVDEPPAQTRRRKPL